MSTTKTISFQAPNPPPSAEKVRKGLSYRALVKHTTSRYVLVLNCFFTKTENSWAMKKVTSINVCKYQVMNGFLLFTNNSEEWLKYTFLETHPPWSLSGSLWTNNNHICISRICTGRQSESTEHKAKSGFGNNSLIRLCGDIADIDLDVY